MTKHLLIADDEPSVLAVLRMFFVRQGYRVTLASNGQQAVELAHTEQPDVIILDIQMPKKSGIEVVRELRANDAFAHTLMIALTGYVRDYVPTEVADVGFDHVLSKPFDFAELHEVVSTIGA